MTFYQMPRIAKFPSGIELIDTFGIKAVNTSGPIRPGDDILLRFALLNSAETQTDGSVIYRNIAEVSESDFMAVYDKKMLWRANLYIAEEDSDWNDVNPWVKGNEWNKTYDGITLGSSPADGGQVVTFQPYTPVRSRDKSNWAGNFYKDRVAYDYEMGNALALDSPFDFVKKLQIQKENLKSYYTANPGSVLPYPSRGLTPDILQNWSTTKAPNNRWQNYTKEPSGNNQAYLPGKGFYNYVPKHDTLEPGLPNNYSDAGLGQALSAGVDCVGFAQRAAGYEGSTYQWEKYLEDTGANGGLPTSESASRREYPDLENKKSIAIISREGINNDDSNKEYFTLEIGERGAPSVEDFITFQNKFLSIKPGDIIRYNNDHIGIVTAIDTAAINSAQSIADMMTAVTVIESIYGSAVNFVLKRNMMGGLSGISFVYNNAGSWHYNWDKDLRNWSIERLKVN